MDSKNENMYNWSQKPPLPIPTTQSFTTKQHLPIFYDSANISSLGTSSADNESSFTCGSRKIGTGDDGTSSNYLDSGYSFNTKTNNMTNSSYLSNSSSASSSSSSFIHHHSNILEPIIEDTEMKSFNRFATELTPNTRNIAKINAFHITSPISCNKINNHNYNNRNNGHHNSPSPGKRSACIAFRSNFSNKQQLYENELPQSVSTDTTPAKHRKLVLSNCTNLTPKKSTSAMLPNSSAFSAAAPQSSSLFQSKLYDIDENPLFVDLLSPFNATASINRQCKPLSTLDVADSEKDINDDNDKNTTKTIIPPQSTKNNENILSKPKRKFERHHSIISTSTPFAAPSGSGCDDLTASVPADNKRKFNRFRKVQSFSPSKYLKLQHEKNENIERFQPYKNIVSPLPNWRNCDVDIAESLITPTKVNPAKKFLEFDHEVFDEIIKSSDIIDAKHIPQQRGKLIRQIAYDNIITPSPTSPTPPLQSSSSSSPPPPPPPPSVTNVVDFYDDDDDDDLPRDAKHICDVNASLNLSIIPKTHLDTSIIVHTTFMDDSNENNCHTKLLPTNKNDLNKSLIFSNYSDNLELPKTPSPSPPPQLLSLSSSNTTNASEIIYKTPTKKNQSSYSLYNDQKSSISPTNINTSPRQEQNKILYSNLPCTPPKNLSIRKFTQQKSPSTSPTSSSSSSSLSTTKNKSLPIKRRTLLYNNNSLQLAGLKSLDIIGHLEGNILAIELILSFLSDKQLVECLMVSKKWKRIIECCPKITKRMKHYSKYSAVSKENVPLIDNVNNNNNNIAGMVDCSDHVVYEINNCFSRKPFHNVINWKSTKLTGSRQTNNVTPNEITSNISEFQETQRILQNCSPNARVIKCPRCNRSSIINEKSTTNNNSEKSLSQSSTTSSQNSITSTNSSSSITSLSSSCTTNNTQPLTSSSSSAAYKRRLFQRSIQSHEITMNKTKDYSTLPFQKSSSLCLDFDDFSTTTTTTNNNDNTFYQLFSKTEPNLYNHNNYHHNNSSISSSSSSFAAATPSSFVIATEYAQCTNKKCGFCFCTKCLCDARHLNGVCSWEMHKQQSEEIEDEQELENNFQINQINNNRRRNNNNNEKNASTSTKKKSSSNLSSSYVACSKQSKRNLRRLCSLEN